METSPFVGATSPRTPSPAPPPSSSSVERFAPGTVLADRYRIVAALGKGGMGEVYRADDLKLGHSVALKFLPHAFAEDPRLLERFHAEVRNSRQVSHPNVCRVYDIGEFQGLTFLTMEYIDGEDLASLLRRIGRLPPDKAVEISHQLCAGLAAAHDCGLLHRDLKPANIMLDGRGRARITDFGLAVTADDVGGRQQFAGTPAYMAPEQRSGAPASVKTDIYSLGLVLFEIFTGKRAFEENNLSIWQEAAGAPPSDRPASHASSPSRAGSRTPVTTDVDPAVQRAILRCLDKDPAKRPATALQVAAALPGGDPLAAALAAGETPSPEMVAAAGEEVGISVRNAVLLLVAFVVFAAASIPLSRRSTLIGLAPMGKSPDSLSDRARDIAQKFGYSAADDSTWWFTTSTDYVRYRSKREPSTQWYRDLPTAWRTPYRFHYRQSPRPMSLANPIGTVTPEQPPLTVPGMAYVATDTSGHLVAFRAVPPAVDEESVAGKFDWDALFAETNLDRKTFQEVTPKYTPSSSFDERKAWEGSAGNVSLHLEAAAYRGRLVYFDMTAPWTPPHGGSGEQTTSIIAAILSVMLLVVMPIGGLVMARRNLRLGRGDLNGATRLAVYVTVLCAVQRLVYTHLASATDTINVFVYGVGFAMFFGGMTWVVYMALEPLVRRQSPELLISWTRLLAGRFTDPLVGRDVLIGASSAAFLTFINRLFGALPFWFDIPTAMPQGLPSALTRPLGFASQLLNGMWGGVIIAIALLLLASVSRVWLRTRWPGLIVAAFFVNDIDSSLAGKALAIEIVGSIIASVIVIWLLARVGPLAFTVWLLVVGVLQAYAPTDVRFGTWYVGYGLFALALVAALAAFSFHSALAGRPLGSRFEEV